MNLSIPRSFFWFTCWFLTASLAVSFVAQETQGAPKVFRLGIIGTDTSHVPAFVGLFNDPNAQGVYQNFLVTGAYRGGMPDNDSSWSRRNKYAAEIAPKGVKIYDSIEELLPTVDGVLIEDVDGRPHLEFAKLAILAKKPVFIDKPMAGDLVDVVEIFRLAEKNGVPVFSASSLRYSAGMQKMRNEKPLGNTHGVDAWSPCKTEEHHPDFYWYGIHGVETLFTMMGPGCVSVSRTTSENYDLAVGLWADGRIGTFRGIRAGSAPYGGSVFGDRGVEMAGKYDGYKPLCDQICIFFETGKSPVEARETLEIMAFMSAADVSKAQNGAHVTLESVLEAARTAKVTTFRVTLLDNSTLQLNGKPVTPDQLAQRLTLPAGAQNTYFRVVFEKKPAATEARALEIIRGNLGDGKFVRYIGD